MLRQTLLIVSLVVPCLSGCSLSLSHRNSDPCCSSQSCGHCQEHGRTKTRGLLSRRAKKNASPLFPGDTYGICGCGQCGMQPVCSNGCSCNGCGGELVGAGCGFSGGGCGDISVGAGMYAGGVMSHYGAGSGCDCNSSANMMPPQHVPAVPSTHDQSPQGGSAAEFFEAPKSAAPANGLPPVPRDVPPASQDNSSTPDGDLVPAPEAPLEPISWEVPALPALSQ
jgi:hypothetical protein